VRAVDIVIKGYFCNSASDDLLGIVLAVMIMISALLLPPLSQESREITMLMWFIVLSRSWVVACCVGWIYLVSWGCVPLAIDYNKWGFIGWSGPEGRKKVSLQCLFNWIYSLTIRFTTLNVIILLVPVTKLNRGTVELTGFFIFDRGIS
jgi:hypothetical protein